MSDARQKLAHRTPVGKAIAQRATKEVRSVPKYTRNTGKPWTATDDKQLRQLANENTPTRVIGLKLGRTEDAIYSRASQEGVSLAPVNQSPYNRSKK